MDASEIRDKEATCGNCPWYECCKIVRWQADNHGGRGCKDHPLNKLAEARWLEGQMADRSIALGKNFLPLGDTWRGRAEASEHNFGIMMGERDEIREQLTDCMEKNLTLARKLTTCAAGLWEDYDEAKHKDGKYWLMRHRGCAPIVVRWISRANIWRTPSGDDVRQYNPIRVAELREDV